MRIFEGVTCSLELAFDYNSRLYVYEVQPDWYEEYLSLEEEILAESRRRAEMEDDELARRVLLQELTRCMPEPLAVSRRRCAKGRGARLRRCASARSPPACSSHRGFDRARCRAPLSPSRPSTNCTIR